MMRASILVVAVTALLHAPSPASAQDPPPTPGTRWRFRRKTTASPSISTGSGSSRDTTRHSRMRAGLPSGPILAASRGLIASLRHRFQHLNRGGDDAPTKGKRNADCDHIGADNSELWSGLGQSTGFIIQRMQGVQRPEGRLHEELCRADLQDRISDVHEIVPQELVCA
jgi:hypothetical protein